MSFEQAERYIPLTDGQIEAMGGDPVALKGHLRVENAHLFCTVIEGRAKKGADREKAIPMLRASNDLRKSTEVSLRGLQPHFPMLAEELKNHVCRAFEIEDASNPLANR